MDINSIDWTNPTNKVSNHFTVKEALWLPSWSRMATEADGLNDSIKSNLLILFDKLDQVRDLFNSPINIHVTFRPPLYNQQIGGAANSAHMYGKAVDFDISGHNCDDVRQYIIDYHVLEALNMRMERKPGGNWVHLDYNPPNPNRYFYP